MCAKNVNININKVRSYYIRRFSSKLKELCLKVLTYLITYEENFVDNFIENVWDNFVDNFIENVWDNFIFISSTVLVTISKALGKGWKKPES